MKALIYSEGPCVPTGFGTVCKNIFLPLMQRKVFEDVNFFGINYFGDPHDLPCKIFPAIIGGNDPYGKAKFYHECLGGRWDFDVLFILQDHFILTMNGENGPWMPELIDKLHEQVAAGKRKPFKVIAYIPVDCVTLQPHWVNWYKTHVDYPVAYLPWSGELLSEYVPGLGEKLRVIEHGTNPDIFYPLHGDEVRAFRSGPFGLTPDQPLIAFINRNQPRKDPVAALRVFREILNEIPRAVLYMHLNTEDSMCAVHLPTVQHHLRIPQDSVKFPMNFTEGIGLPLESLNQIYNAADVVLTTSRGEGYGLTCSEAMTIGKPVVAPAHTSFNDLFADGRGVLVPPSGIDVSSADNSNIRPTSDVPAMAAAVIDLLRSKSKMDAMGARARSWALERPWGGVISQQWEAVFREAEAALGSETKETKDRYSIIKGGK